MLFQVINVILNVILATQEDILIFVLSVFVFH